MCNKVFVFIFIDTLNINKYQYLIFIKFSRRFIFILKILLIKKLAQEKNDTYKSLAKKNKRLTSKLSKARKALRRPKQLYDEPDDTTSVITEKENLIDSLIKEELVEMLSDQNDL